MLQLADELPSLFARLDGMAGNSNELNKLSAVLSDFFLSSYLKSSL
jgi:hypothetical protein